MASTFTDNDGNVIRTMHVRPKDLRVGDRKPRIVEVGPFGKYEEEVVESVELRKDIHGPGFLTRAGRTSTYWIVLVDSHGNRRTAHVMPQASVEVVAR